MSGVQRRKKGKETRVTILRAAKDMLLEDGYGKFVFRGVAKRAGVEPGNVQYYFASKRDLIWAVLEPELVGYLDRLENAVKRGRTKEEKITRMVRFLLADVTSKDTLNLWVAIWGMAAHDEELAKMVSVFYLTFIDGLCASLREIFPQLGKDRATELATLITAQFDGLLIIFLLGKPKLKTIAGIKRNFGAVVTRLIDAHQGN